MSICDAGADLAPEASGEGWALYFGGPDKPARRLRDLLSRLVDRQPAGAEIRWVTYYFRDVDLARRLIAANDRGVDVMLVMEGSPRREGANDEVISLLRTHGLRGGLHVRQPRRGLATWLTGRLHSKIYGFTHPAPQSLIGSFNPSGNDPEDPEVVAEIGDQDRGHNLLLRLEDPRLVAGLNRQVRRLARDKVTIRLRFSLRQNMRVRGLVGDLFFYPRIWPKVIAKSMRSLSSTAHLRGAISHIDSRGLGSDLVMLAQDGARVSLVVHDTERRAPEESLQALITAGAETLRYRHPEALPMHAKFILVEAGRETTSWLGSFNGNRKSLWYHDEVLLRARDSALFDALRRRFDEIREQARRLAEA